MATKQTEQTEQTEQTDTTQPQQPQQAATKPELMIGRMVHYVDHAEECRAAIVTHVPLGEDGQPEPDGLCSLVWFDFQPHAAGNVRHKALVAGEEPTPHTYHWFGSQVGASH